MAGITVRVQQDRLRAELDRFTRNLSPALVDSVTRKTAFDIGGDIVRSLNGTEAGFPVPKRIDTGRYRAAWSIGVREATGKAPGPTTGGDADNPQQIDDGEGREIKRNARAVVRVTNNVEYGPYIEDGTEAMRPGHHLKLSLLRGAVRLREAIGKAVPLAWSRAIVEGF